MNLLYAEAEKMDKIRNFRMYIGPGSDGSSADKQSLDLKFNPWDTAITFQLASSAVWRVPAVTRRSTKMSR